MSKAIVIQKNGVDQQISVDRLSTPKVGGGRELWIPEDETNTGSVTVDTNGTVNASDAGLYGFHEANIDVKCVTGKKGGKTYKVTVDEDGYLDYTEVMGEVASIAVTTPPTYTIYGDGAYLNYTGIVVHAYDDNGNDMGAIPFENLIFPVTVAVYDPEAPYPIASVNDPSILRQPQNAETIPFAVTDEIKGNQEGGSQYTELKANNPAGTVFGLVINNSQNNTYSLQLYSDKSFSYTRIAAGRTRTGDSSVYVYPNGNEVHYTDEGFFNTVFVYNVPIFVPTDTAIGTADKTDYGYIVIYGIHLGGTQIPVQYERPGDGTVLETSFGITVIPAGGHGED